MIRRSNLTGEFKSLIRKVENIYNAGALDSSDRFLNNIRNRINREINTLKRKNQEIHRRDFNKGFLKNFNIFKKTYENRHIGLSPYNLSQIEPELKKIYQEGVNKSLSLINTQDEAIMNKLQLRFGEWINEKSEGVKSKEHLRDIIKLPDDKHVKFILRDQCNKASAAMDNAIAKHYKAIAFEWRTQQDKRVVGNPSGLYPKVAKEEAHGNHYKRHGKFYLYKYNINNDIREYLDFSKFEGFDTDLPDGLPGNAYGCRCYAKNYYDIRDLPKFLIKK